jgi:hypothetical protein
MGISAFDDQPLTGGQFENSVAFLREKPVFDVFLFAKIILTVVVQNDYAARHDTVE